MAYSAKTIHELTTGVPDPTNDELVFWDTSADAVRKVTLATALSNVSTSLGRVLVTINYSDLTTSPSGVVLWWPTDDFVLTDVELIVTTTWIAGTATHLSLGNAQLIGGVADPQHYLSQEQCLAANLATQNVVISGYHNAHERAVLSGGLRHFMLGGVQPLSNENSARYIKIVTNGTWTAGVAMLCIRGYYL